MSKIQEVEMEDNLNNPQNPGLNKPDVSNRLISEAIQNDKAIQQLIVEKVKIHEISIPITIVKNGETIQVWSDEVNKAVLNIDELIEHRKQQIIGFYS